MTKESVMKASLLFVMKELSAQAVQRRHNHLHRHRRHDDDEDDYDDDAD